MEYNTTRYEGAANLSSARIFLGGGGFLAGTPLRTNTQKSSIIILENACCV